MYKVETYHLDEEDIKALIAKEYDVEVNAITMESSKDNFYGGTNITATFEVSDKKRDRFREDGW